MPGQGRIKKGAVIVMKKTAKNEKSLADLARYSAIGAAQGVMLTIAVMFIFAAAMRIGWLPASLSNTFIIASVVAGSACGGWYCAKKQGRGVVTAGACSAAAYIILILIGTMLFAKSGTEPGLTLRVIIASGAGGVFGGVMKLNRTNKKLKNRR